MQESPSVLTSAPASRACSGKQDWVDHVCRKYQEQNKEGERFSKVPASFPTYTPPGLLIL